MARIPKLCRHRGSGQGYVTDPRTRGEVYLGPWGRPETEAAYRTWVQEYLTWLDTAPGERTGSGGRGVVSISELVAGFLQWAQEYYRKGDRQTSEFTVIREAMRPLVSRFGGLPVARFGVRNYLTIREEFTGRGLARTSINAYCSRIIRLFRWGAERELCSPSLWQSLRAVPGLKRGRGQVRETERVPPVPEEALERTLRQCDSRTAALIRLQLVTGLRPGEVVAMTRDSIDQSGEPWLYTIQEHKTTHRGQSRLVFLGPQAREILTPFLERAGAPPGYLFPSRRLPHLSEPAYRAIVYRACDRAGVDRWGPNRLRHNAATRIRQAHGLEATQVILGHSTADTTQIYAERDLALARRVAEQDG